MIKIGDRCVGEDYPALIIAELSGNHHKSLVTAKALVQAAADAGADAVKTQCFRPESMCWPGPEIVWQGQQRRLYDLYAETMLPWEWHKPLKDMTESLGMVYFASVFDKKSTDYMAVLNVPCYKIASFELTDTPLIRYVASKGAPLILSTGMATRSEIWQALEAALEGRCDRCACSENRPLIPMCPTVLLKCTSAYPADSTDANLRTLGDLRRLNPPCPTGLSDHTLGIAVPVAAVALGASVIEKHLTLSRATGGPDAEFSLEPDEFSRLVDAVRVTEKALGKVHYGPTQAEQSSLALRRSLWVVKDIAAGESFTEQNIRSLRPADGLPPGYLPDVLGGTARQDISAGTPLNWDLLGDF